MCPTVGPEGGGGVPFVPAPKEEDVGGTKPPGNPPVIALRLRYWRGLLPPMPWGYLRPETPASPRTPPRSGEGQRRGPRARRRRQRTRLELRYVALDARYIAWIADAAVEECARSLLFGAQRHVQPRIVGVVQRA